MVDSHLGGRERRQERSGDREGEGVQAPRGIRWPHWPGEKGCLPEGAAQPSWRIVVALEPFLMLLER